MLLARENGHHERVRRSEVTVEIARSPAEVFAYLTDVENVPAWQSTAIETRLCDGELRVGARIAEVRSFVGRRVEAELEVTEYEPDRLFSLRTVSGPVKVEVHHRLEPNRDGGTRLTFVGHGESHGFGGIAQSLLVKAAEREFKRDFQRLKQILEAGD
jgi:uncharacterized protein YndB with AHSA1/START domain